MDYQTMRNLDAALANKEISPRTVAAAVRRVTGRRLPAEHRTIQNITSQFRVARKMAANH